MGSIDENANFLEKKRRGAQIKREKFFTISALANNWSNFSKMGCRRISDLSWMGNFQ
jgi:hypothetical protein